MIALVAVALVASQVASGQNPSALLTSFKGASKRNDVGSGERALKDLLVFEDERVYELFVDQLFDSRFANQAKWCLIREGRAGFAAGWKKARANADRNAHLLYQVWAQCGPGGIREIVQGLVDPSSQVRWATVRYIANAGLGSTPRWIQMATLRSEIPKFYQDRDAATRKYAIAATLRGVLTGKKDPLALEVLALARDPSSVVRAKVAESIPHLQSYGASIEKCTDALVLASKDRSKEVRFAAIDGLDWIFGYLAAEQVFRRLEALARLAGDRVADPEASALSRLGRWFHPDGPRVRGMADDESSRGLVDRARSFLRKKGVERIAQARLKEQAAHRGAIYALTTMNPGRAWPHLVRDLKSPDPLTFSTAAHLLPITCRPGVRELLEGFRDRLGGDTDRLIKEFEDRATAKAMASGGN